MGLEEMWEEMDRSIDEHIKHFDGVVDDKECQKRKFLRVLSCEICSYVFVLKYMSENKSDFQNDPGIYQTDQELEKYIEDNREHISKHGLIPIK